MSYTAVEAKAIVNAHLSINVDQYEQVSRDMHVYNAVTKLAVVKHEDASNEKLGGFLSSTYLTVDTSDPNKVVLRSDHRYNNVNYDIITTVYNHDGVITMSQYMALKFSQFKANEAAIVASQAFKNAKTQLGGVPTDEYVLTVMATGYSTYREDVPQYQPGDLVLSIITTPMGNNRVRVESLFTKYGVAEFLLALTPALDENITIEDVGCL